MKPSMRTKLEQLAKRLDEIDVHLSDEHAARDMNRFRTLGQERSEIEPVVSRFHDYRRAESDLQSAQQMLSEPEMKALAEEEIDSSKARIAALESELQGLLLPKDPNDERNIFLEIRAGTGGDESGLFAGRPAAHVHALCRASSLVERDDFRKLVRHGRLQGSHRAAGRQPALTRS